MIVVLTGRTRIARSSSRLFLLRFGFRQPLPHRRRQSGIATTIATRVHLSQTLRGLLRSVPGSPVVELHKAT
jgi:hypothetical protein